MAITLRPYQNDLVGVVRAAFAKHRRVLAVAPTGAGKTVIFAYITSNAAAKGKRVVISAHRVEIVQQISKALDGLGVRHGRIQTGHSMTDDLVQVGMIQTIGKRIDKIPAPDLFVIDEAHHAVAGQWAKVSEAWTTGRILGVTATPQRLDGRGLGASFDEMVMGPEMGELIREGFLAEYTYLAPPQMVDLSAISTRMGDFAIDELANAMQKAVITGDSVKHYTQHLGGRPAIAFCCNIAHARHVSEQFSAAGYRAAYVDGTMDAKLRRELIASIGDGRLQVLASADLISEGTDLPAVSGAILLRPSKSVAMFLQQVGRVLRIKPDDSKAIILDHVGGVGRHGLPDQHREWSLDSKKTKEAPAAIMTCKSCYQAFPAGTKQAACGTEPDCIFAAREVAEREMIETVAGELVELQAADAAAAQVIRDTPLSILMQTAVTRDDMGRIAKAKGYKAGWVFKVMEERRRLKVAA